MSPLNTFAAQLGRAAARPNAQQAAPQDQSQQPAWGQQGQPQSAAPQSAAPQWGQPQAPQAGYGQQGFAQQSYGQPQDYHAAQGAPYGAGHAPQADPYAPQFESYAAAAATPRANQQGYQPQQQYAPAQNWQPQQTDQRGPDTRAYDVGAYMTQAQAAAAQASAAYRQQHEPDPSLHDWQQHQGHNQGHDNMGFAQAAGGELDPNYGEEEAEYDAEDAPRGRRSLMMAAALAGAIFVGGGLAYGYKNFLSGPSSGEPPVVKSASSPSKIKPADAGGKQFAHSDSKIMGRLGDGAAGAAAAASTAASAGETDANGTRKVATLVVGRDGSIQAPPASEAVAPAAGDVAVPGMTVVDVLGGSKVQSAAAAVATAANETAAAVQAAPQVPQQAAQKLVVAPPAAAQKPVTVAKAVSAAAPVAAAPASTGSIDGEAAAPVAPAPPKKVKKVAAAPAATATDATAAPAPASVATTGGGSNGYVAVLASVPQSGSSRMDALKKFADMQQKYSSALSGKTPDVAEANLGAKGAYHRLVVGPPGSREQASSLCTQLKTQGYADCWVTSY